VGSTPTGPTNFLFSIEKEVMTTIINMYGGPGVGKSTSAAYLYYLLKADGHNVELVREYVKDWAYESRKFSAYDEIYFLGKQVRHESMLFGKVDWIITDAPVYMTAYYASIYCSPQLAHGVAEAAQAFYQQAKNDGHQHLHIMLQRTKPYRADGRYQTEEQALQVDRGIRDLLDKFETPVIESTPEEMSLRFTLEMCLSLNQTSQS
jgi:nicotinamide riboside kinase